MDLKERIAANFSASSARYDRYAVMQQQAALSLVRRLPELRQQLPVGPVLEIGCGTGTVSRELLTLFPGRALTLLDLAPGMIEENRQCLAPYLATAHQVDWQVGDAETIDFRRRYALITSCLTLQWFQDLPASLCRLSDALLPEGILLFSYLGDKSFPEWRRACLALNLPCTLNRLPNNQQIVETLHDLGYEATTASEMIEQHYPSALDFFRSLKKTGAGTHSTLDRLSVSQMARLLAFWSQDKRGTVTVTYQINTVQVRA